MEPFVVAAFEHLRQRLPESEFRLLSTDSYVYLNKASAKLDLVRFFVKGDMTRSVTVSSDGKTVTATWLAMKIPQVLAPDNQFRLSGIAEDMSQDISVVNGHVNEIVSGGRNNKSVISISQAEDHQIIQKVLPNGKANPDDAPQWLPEFTIVAEIGGIQRTLYSLYWLTNMNSAYLYAYTNLNPYEPIDIGGVVSAPGQAPSSGDEILIIESYEYETPPAVKLDKIMKCFEGIPDAGAKYSMTMYVDIPNTSDPTQLTKNFSPGHTFLAMTKSNGQSSITQVFGFYPSVGSLSFFGSAVKSKIRDNSDHEYDASITIDDVDSYSFNTAAYLAQYYSNGMHYDINDFNCTDFAIDVFNKARPLDDQITVPDWTLNSVGVNCGTTPNGLYQILSSAKDNNTPSSKDIDVKTSQAPKGKGECQ